MAPGQASRLPTQLWNIKEGVYTPSQIIQKVSPLLETVLSQLGTDSPNSPSSRTLLLANLATCLSTNSRESALAFPTDLTDGGRLEIQGQAKRIGEFIVKEVSAAKLGDANVTIRSPCKGHLWTHAVANLLMGPRSNGELMQLFNEYLHQLILLRDSLIPFQNFEEVLYHIKEAPSGPGLRVFEKNRQTLLLECFSRTVSQKTLVEVAKTFTAPDLPTGGYGFQYSSGLVLPAFLAGCSSLRLSRFCSAKLDKTTKTSLLFDYEHLDYYNAPRAEISTPLHAIPPHTWPDDRLHSTTQTLSSCSLHVGKSRDAPKDSVRRQLELRLEFSDGSCMAVDIGQIARGRRYSTDLHIASAYAQQKEAQTPNLLSTPSSLHKVTNILALPGLVSSTKPGTHIILGVNPIVRLALLGKLYPHNVFLLDGKEELGISESIEARFGARFLIVGGQTESCEGIGGSVFNDAVVKQ